VGKVGGADDRAAQASRGVFKGGQEIDSQVSSVGVGQVAGGSEAQSGGQQGGSTLDAEGLVCGVEHMGSAGDGGEADAYSWGQGMLTVAATDNLRGMDHVAVQALGDDAAGEGGGDEAASNRPGSGPVQGAGDVASMGGMGRVHVGGGGGEAGSCATCHDRARARRSAHRKPSSEAAEARPRLPPCEEDGQAGPSHCRGQVERRRAALQGPALRTEACVGESQGAGAGARVEHVACWREARQEEEAINDRNDP